MSTHRVVIVDDSYLARAGMRAVLDAAGGIEVVGEGIDLDDGLEQVLATDPDVVITDIRMPPTGIDEGIQLARILGERGPRPGVIALSQHLERDLARRLFESSAGGRGYLLKERLADPEEMRAAVARVAAGAHVIDPAVVAAMMADPQGPATGQGGDPLTAREEQVLRLMSDGLANGAIARRLGVSRSSVENHVRSVFAKLGVADDGEVSPRVAAVLAWLESPAGPSHGDGTIAG